MNHESKETPVTYEDGSKGTMVLQYPIKEKKKVYIVGCASTKNQVPWDDKDAEYWGVNNLYGVPLEGSHYDRWFEIHNIWQDPKTNKFLRRGLTDFRGQPIMEYMEGLGKIGCTVYMQKHWANLIPYSITYPLDEIVNFFINKGLTIDFCRYLTNTIAYEIVLAIYLGFEEIQVWGVDMAVGCLAPEVKVLTSDLRWVPSGDIEVGDELMAFDEESNYGDGKTRKWRKAIVTANPVIKKPCYRIYLEDGTEMVASAKHGWLTHAENRKRWKTTEQLVTSHHRTGRPTRIVKAVDVREPDNSWESGYIAAAFDGEGCLSQFARKDHIGSHALSLGFAQRNNPMMETVQRILKSRGYKIGKLQQNGENSNQFHVTGGKPEILKFLSEFRPPRLLENFNPNIVGEFQHTNNIAVTGIEFIGEQTVMGLETDTKTYIAEGFASHNSEYEHQKACCEFWLGVALGMGIRVHIPSQADLIKTRFLYGFEEKQSDIWNEKTEKIRVDMKLKRIRMENEVKEAEKAIEQYRGGEKVVEEIKKIWANLADDLSYYKRGTL